MGLQSCDLSAIRRKFLLDRGIRHHLRDVDRDDDLKLSIGSTAILAGNQVVTVVGVLMSITIGFWLLMGIVLELTTSFYVASLIIAGLFGYQWNELRKPDNRKGWFVAFKSNIWVGTALMVGTAMGLAS